MKRRKRNLRAALGVAFALAMLPVCARAQSLPSGAPAPAAASVGDAPTPPKRLKIILSPPPQSTAASTAAPTETSDAHAASAVLMTPVKPSASWASAENIIPFVRDNLEGGGAWYWPDPSRYGIKACPENDVTVDQLRAMTPDGAYRKLKALIWDRLHIDDLPPDMRMPVMAAGVHMGAGDHGRGPVQRMIAESGDDPQRFMELYAEKLHSLHNYIPEWDVRIDQIKNVMDYRGDRPLAEIAAANPVSSHYSLARLWRKRRAPETQLAAAGAAPIAAPAPAQISDGDATPYSVPAAPHPLPWLAGLIAAGLMLAGAARGLQGNPRRAETVAQTPLTPANQTPPFPVPPPFRAPQGGLALQQAAPATGVQPAASSDELTAEEYAAMMAVYGAYNPVRRENFWHVPYSRKNHVFVQKGRLHLSGAEGMEEALRYAARAWGNKCRVSGASPQMLAHMRNVAQKLIAEGVVDRGFMIEPAEQNAPAPRPAPRRPLPRPGQNAAAPRRLGPSIGGAAYA